MRTLQRRAKDCECQRDVIMLSIGCVITLIYRPSTQQTNWPITARLRWAIEWGRVSLNSCQCFPGEWNNGHVPLTDILVGWIQIRTQALCLSFPKQLPRLRDTEFWNDQLVQQRIWIGLDKEHDAQRTQIAVYPQEKLCNWIPSFPLKLNTSKITDSFQFCVFKFCEKCWGVWVSCSVLNKGVISFYLFGVY